MSTVAFTICSNNYFAMAKVLGDSWLSNHPDTKFVIVLVDEMHEAVNYHFDSRVHLLTLEELDLPNLRDLITQYNIIELNTAIKADAFIKIFRHYNAGKVLYLDPDIQVFSPLQEAIELLDNYNIIVTPHFCTPIDDGSSTTDIKMMGSGLFNLGFIGLSDLEKVTAFLNWWRARLYKYCYFDLSNNMFYDQVWINYVTVFFDNYYILKHRGYNMAIWNFHERAISPAGSGHFNVNETVPLRFFHYSGYKLNQPEMFAFYHFRYSWGSRPDVERLFNQYRQLLINNNAEKLSRIPCVYYEKHKQLKAEKELEELKNMPLKIRLVKKAARFARKVLLNQ